MPICFNKDINSNSKIIIWDMTESEDILHEIANHRDGIDDIKKISSSKRRKEILTTYAILESELQGDINILHHESGAPYIKQYPDLHISISHTVGFCCVIISNSRCAVDIELSCRNFTHASSKYISQIEKSRIDTTNYGLVWCAKETIYKFLQDITVDFTKDMTVLNINDNSLNINVLDRCYNLTHYNINGLYIVFFA